MVLKRLLNVCLLDYFKKLTMFSRKLYIFILYTLILVKDFQICEREKVIVIQKLLRLVGIILSMRYISSVVIRF